MLSLISVNREAELKRYSNEERARSAKDEARNQGSGIAE